MTEQSAGSGQGLGSRRRGRSITQELAAFLLERQWLNGRTAVLRSARAIMDTTRTALPPSLPNSFPKKPAYLDAHFGEEITPPVWAAHCFLAGYDKTIPISETLDEDVCRIADSDARIARDWFPPHLRDQHSDPFERRLVLCGENLPGRRTRDIGAHCVDTCFGRLLGNRKTFARHSDTRFNWPVC